jgi:hypothetical protein
MTADPALLSRADRERLLERLAELRALAGLMKERGNLPPAPEPVPLHRTSRDTTTERTRP